MIDEKQGKYPEVLIGRVAEGRHKGKLIRFRGQQFLGLSAPTRSGKGVGIVIPNLVNYSDSVVNNDIKFENFRKTAGFRQMCGQEVFLFSPDGYTITDLDRDKGYCVHIVGIQCRTFVVKTSIVSVTFLRFQRFSTRLRVIKTIFGTNWRVSCLKV
ncbi:type IV secretory system conjugative DNA transfer family protein [Vibrio campbellii]|uniref:type IV secretory system conjugative DNA transfer family protein n=1 Tax=Vibrio campbellii TaxID=680 RepID=UPI0020B16BFF|nr:type IV secretory system conjugative DNA transfer family protein [Vibrio campbellii]